MILQFITLTVHREQTCVCSGRTQDKPNVYAEQYIYSGNARTIYNTKHTRGTNVRLAAPLARWAEFLWEIILQDIHTGNEHAFAWPLARQAEYLWGTIYIFREYIILQFIILTIHREQRCVCLAPRKTGRIILGNYIYSGNI